MPAITLVIAPKVPWNGVVRWNEVALCQSTSPAKTGTMPERNASTAEMHATGSATRVTHLMPARLIATKPSRMPIASGFTGMPGRYQSCRADAERIAVRPQVGTQPHQ